MAIKTTSRIVRLVFALAVVVVAAPIATAAAADITVTITTTLSEKALTVAPGTTVEWVNQDDERHRMRSDDGPAKFDSGDLEPGESYGFTFSIEGTYPYVDHREDDDTAYHGTIVVASDAPSPPPGGGGGGSPPPTTPPATPPPPTSGDVSIGDDLFSPQSITVGVGATVSWVNNDDSEHTVTSDGGGFDSGILNPGGSFSQTFDSAGSFSYICILHSGMSGTVTATGGGSAGGSGGGAGGDVGSPSTTVPPPSVPDTTVLPPDSPPAAPGAISIFDFEYSPGSRSVPAGSTVRWVNQGDIPHTVTSLAGGFDSGLVFSGSEYTRTFSETGTFDYICTLHPEMSGTITVTGGGVTDDGEASSAPEGTAPTTSTSTTDDSTSSVSSSEASTAAPSEGGNPDGGPSPVTSVRIVDLAYDPEPVSVEAGATVRWSNTGALPHTVTAEDAGFDSGIIDVGGSFEQVFDEVGTYRYLCALHPGMEGTVEVTAKVTSDDGAAGGTLAAGAPTPPEGGGGLGLGVAVVLALIIVGSAAAFSFGMSRFAAAVAGHE